MIYANQTVVYKAYADGMPIAGKTLAIEPRAFDCEAPPPVGGLTVKNLYLSFDPWQRAQMRLPDNADTYSRPWAENTPAEVIGISEVLKSDNPRFGPGDTIIGFTAAGEYSRIPEALAAESRMLPQLGTGIPLHTLINIVGAPGMAAYNSFFEYIPKPYHNKTICISAASGAVGQLVGQLCKLHQMRVIGSTGSEEKVAFVVNEIGYDAAWDYHSESAASALDRLAPEGLDIYYDNVGGEQLETALSRMKDFGTVVVSGMISQVNVPDDQKYGVKTLLNIVYRRLKVQGFVCSDIGLLAKYMSSFETDMIKWYLEGKIQTREHVVSGMENAIEAWLTMFNGEKIGKVVLKLG
ncbi:putative zinc-type alcohol dehydrogenase-like protein PB24D3.08c [Xylariaceae sp. FL1272]|nr:putative zinc-type alcohol dehydrogenase-like protein PB24D3.08c [Xylariaceae sp. FL1272]